MPDIFNYTDYRLFLHDSYKAGKAADSRITHRYISEKLGFSSSGFFSLVISGRSNISEDAALKFASFFQCKKRETEYFLTMVLFNQAVSHRERRELFQKLISFNRGRVSQVEARHYAFYHKWYHSVVRELVAFAEIEDTSECFARVAQMVEPPLRPLQVKQSLRLLQKLGFIVKDKYGIFQRTNRVITTGEQARNVAITNVAGEMLHLSLRALEELPREKRSISSLFLSLSEQGYQEINERISLFRRELLEIAYRDRGVDRVCHVGIQAIPVSREPRKTRRRTR